MASALLCLVAMSGVFVADSFDARGVVDEYFYQLSVGNLSALLDLYSDDAVGTFPQAGMVHGKEALRSFYTNITTNLNPRRCRATDFVVEGHRAASPLHCEGTDTHTGKPVYVDNINYWKFALDGRIQELRVYNGEVPNEPVPSIISVSLPDPSRSGRLVNATICVPGGSAKLPLLIFSHGWLVAAEDYDYVCHKLATDPAQPWAVALIETPLEDPSVQPPLLTPLAADAAFLSKTLPLVTEPSPLAGRLSGKIVLGGHSMGGGTSVLAATHPLDAQVDALALWAPGLYGSPNANASTTDVPMLILAGASDCVNVPDVALRAIDTYQVSGAQKKALVLIKDANHCFWSTPVKGNCNYDICTALPRLAQQATGLTIFKRFASAALDGSMEAWSALEKFLAMGHDTDTGAEWKAVSTANGNKTVGPIPYPLCPKQCCSPALAGMGLCAREEIVF